MRPMPQQPQTSSQHSEASQPARSLPQEHRLHSGRQPGVWGGRVRVLVVEDDRELAEAIGVGLRREQMAVDVAFDGDAGLERAMVYG